MTYPAPPRSHVHVVPRPPLRRAGRAALVLLAFLALSAIGGGAALVARPDGGLMQWSVAMLAGSPFADFLAPGLILGGVFGVGSLVTIALGLRRQRGAPYLAFAIGVGLMIWIVVELAIIGEFSFLHPTMFAIGLGLAASAVAWGWPSFQAWRGR